MTGQLLGATGGGFILAGKLSIPTTESTSATAYAATNLATPDRVSGVVVPQDGMVVVAYQAIWQNTVASNGRAAIFIGANQVKLAPGNAAPVVSEAVGNSTTNVDVALATNSAGIGGATGTGGQTEVTTGQIVTRDGGSGDGGPAYIGMLAAGTYDITIQFKNNAAGTLTVKNRHLWVWVIG